VSRFLTTFRIDDGATSVRGFCRSDACECQGGERFEGSGEPLNQDYIGELQTKSTLRFVNQVVSKKYYRSASGVATGFPGPWHVVHARACLSFPKSVS
jgi:hypothetical protein